MLLSVSLFSALAFVLSAIFIPLIIKFCRVYSLYDTVNARKIHSGNIPRLGGVGIALSFIICAVICFLLNESLSMKNSWPILVSGMIIFIFGIIDDIVELKAIIKLIVQLIASAIVVVNGFYFRKVFGLTLPWFVGMPLTFFWIIGIINSYNLIDGMDGLCSSLAITVLTSLGFIFYKNTGDAFAVCFILSGAILGFLIYNLPIPNAKIFMGDGGSQFLGFMIATIPLYTSTDNFEFNKLLMMIVLVSFPLFDTIAAIWRRIRDHRPIMSPDKLHLHHKLLNLGFTKVQALIIVILIQILICMTVVFSTYLGRLKATAMLLIALLFMTGFFTVIHYTNRAVLRKIRNDNAARNSGIVPDYHKETSGKTDDGGPSEA